MRVKTYRGVISCSLLSGAEQIAQCGELTVKEGLPWTRWLLFARGSINIADMLGPLPMLGDIL